MVDCSDGCILKSLEENILAARTSPPLQYYATVTEVFLLLMYQPTKVPQITILNIIGISSPLAVKPLKSGLPRVALTTTQSHKVGKIPKIKPLSTVGCLTNNA
ncbi:MAG: hypothetical protein WKG06_15125 [Segetibacter sp.]